MLALPALAAEMYNDDAHGFDLSIPAGWTAQKWDADNIALKVASPDGLDAGGLYVLVYPVQGRSLDGYADAMRKFILNDMNGKVISDSRMVISGRPAVRIVYEGKGINYVQGERRYMRAVVFGDHHIYVIHGVAVPEMFDNYNEAFGKMIDSFQLR